MLGLRREQVIVKSAREIDAMARAGRLASECLAWILSEVRPGITTADIDDLQTQFVRKHGVVAAPLNYRSSSGGPPFPRSICTSVDDVVCHGIPSPSRKLREGQIIGVDVTLIVEGFHGDNAATVPVGAVSEEAMALIVASLEANRRGIEAVAVGARLGDIGAAIQATVEPQGYSVVRDFCGHGVGREFHEPPQILHYGEAGKGMRLRPGHTFTIEPMINAGGWRTKVLDDAWTAVTLDGSLSAQFEHSVAVTAEGVRVLTVQNDAGTWEPPGRWYPPGYVVDQGQVAGAREVNTV